jgi:nitroreductase
VEYKLPAGVFPLVQLVMGYPAESPAPRPRFPLSFVLFEDQYPEFDDSQLEAAMQVMDEGYLAQDYYRQLKARIRLEVDREEIFNYETYSWTEHISRKWGQWFPSLSDLLGEFEARGFILKERNP